MITCCSLSSCARRGYKLVEFLGEAVSDAVSFADDFVICLTLFFKLLSPLLSLFEEQTLLARGPDTVLGAH